MIWARGLSPRPLLGEGALEVLDILEVLDFLEILGYPIPPPWEGPGGGLKRHLIAIQDIYPVFGVVFLHFLPFQVIEFIAYFAFFLISLIPVLPLPRYLSVKLSKQHQSESTLSLFLMPIFIAPASVSVSLTVLV